jgi:hypothetical protein
LIKIKNVRYQARLAVGPDGALARQPAVATFAACPGRTLAYWPDLKSATSTSPLSTSTLESSLFTDPEGSAHLSIKTSLEISRLGQKVFLRIKRWRDSGPSYRSRCTDVGDGLFDLLQ